MLWWPQSQSGWSPWEICILFLMRLFVNLLLTDYIDLIPWAALKGIGTADIITSRPWSRFLYLYEVLSFQGWIRLWRISSPWEERSINQAAENIIASDVGSVQISLRSPDLWHASERNIIGVIDYSWTMGGSQKLTTKHWTPAYCHTWAHVERLHWLPKHPQLSSALFFFF